MSAHPTRRATLLLAFATVLVIGAAIAPVASAQDAASYEIRVAKAEDTVSTHASRITRWERQALLTMIIGVVVVLLGSMTAILQGISRPWTKTATVIVGALVTSMTVINSTFFDADYKTLSRRSEEGRSLLASADRWLTHARSLKLDVDREEALRYLLKIAEALAELDAGGQKGRPLAQSSESSTTRYFQLTTLFAAGPGCGCTALQRKDDGMYKFFCGQGTAESLSEARARATEDAVRQAVQSLQRSSQRGAASPTGESLTAYIRSVASEVDACPIGGSSRVSIYVLLRIPAMLTTQKAQEAFAAPAKARRGLRLKLDKIRVVEDGSAGPTGWTFEVRAGGKSFTLPHRNYTDRPNQNEYALTAGDAAAMDLDAEGRAPTTIEVSGRRSSGGDTAVGSHLIDSAQGTMLVEVKNASTASRGSFTFSFSVAAVR
jgi:hypothetical protein